MENGGMPNVQIDGLPEDAHAVLLQRAALAHQSLPEYLQALLVREASAPTVDKLLERVGHHTGGELSFAQALRLVQDDRQRH